MIEWSGDDEDPVVSPPSVQVPSCSTRVEEQLRGSEEVPEQRATGAFAQQAMGVPEQQAEEVPERWADQRLTVKEVTPLP